VSRRIPSTPGCLAVLLSVTILSGATAEDAVMPSASSETICTFDTPEAVSAQRTAVPGDGATLGFSAEGRRSSGALTITAPGRPCRLTLDLDGHLAPREGVLCSAWVAVAEAGTGARCTLTAHRTTADGRRTSDHLADIPLAHDRWTLLSGWVTRSGVDQRTTLVISAPAGTTLLVDDLRITSSGIPHPLDQRPPLRVAGSRLVADGEPFLLHGVNLSAYSGDEADDPQHALGSIVADDYRDIAAAGFNCVRLNLWHRVFHEANGWAWLRVQHRWATMHGLRLILDLHSPPGGYQSNEYRGSFWTSPEQQQQFIDFWVQLAKAYADAPGIAALDLMNEPLPPDESTWLALAARTLSAVRKAGWDRPIIVESSMRVDGWSETSPKLDDPGVIYDVHFYMPWEFCSQGASTYGQSGRGYDGAVIDAAFLRTHLEQQLLLFARKHQVPVNVGEYGVSGKTLGCGGDRWLADMLNLLRDNGVHAQYFCWTIFDDFALNSGWHRQDPAPRREVLLRLLDRRAK